MGYPFVKTIGGGGVTSVAGKTGAVTLDISDSTALYVVGDKGGSDQSVGAAGEENVELSNFVGQSSWFDNSVPASIKFQPNVGGMFFIDAFLNAGITANRGMEIRLYLNGTLYLNSRKLAATTTGRQTIHDTFAVPLNGSTDYAEIRYYNGDTGTKSILGNVAYTKITCFLAGGA